MRVSYFFLLIILFTSCNFKEQEKSKVKTYFDLEGYFKNEAVRLSKKSKPIVKTVWVNGKSEQKKINIKNWEKELGIFIDADINKDSWKGSFKFSIIDNVKTYVSDNQKIPVNKLEIIEKKGKISSIKIYIQNSNNLYSSQDSLSYYPDSLYEIKKVQHIKLMEKKRYKVEGRFGG